jgi:hypothetical protein
MPQRLLHAGQVGLAGGFGKVGPSLGAGPQVLQVAKACGTGQSIEQADMAERFGRLQLAV